MSREQRAGGWPGSNFLRPWLWSLLATVALGVFIAEALVVPRIRSATERAARQEMRGQLATRRLAVERWIEDALADARTIAKFPSSRALLTPGAEARVDPSFVGILYDFANEHEMQAIGVFGPDRSLLASTQQHPFDSPAWGSVAADLLSRPGDRVALVSLANSEPRVIASVAIPGTAGRVLVVIAADRWLSTMLASGTLPTAGATFEVFQEGYGQASLGLGKVRPGGSAADDLVEQALVRGADWSLQIRLPREVALAAAVERARTWEFSVLALLAALISLGFALVWGQRRSVEALVQRSRARFSMLLEHAYDPILFLDDEGVILRCNQRAEEFYGVPTGGLAGRRFHRDLLAEPTGATFALADGVHLETHRAAQGRVIAVEVSARRQLESGRPVTVVLIRDVQARLEAERRMLELNRQLRAASAVGAAVARERDEAALLRDVLEIVVTIGGMRVAAFAAPTDHDTLAWRGRLDASPALAAINLPLDLVVACCRAGECIVDTDWDGQPSAPTWRRQLAGANACGVVALPVPTGEASSAGMLFVAATPEALLPDAVAVLRALAQDVGLALSSIRERHARKELEATLAALFTSGPVGIAILDKDQRIREANGEFARILGHTQDSAIAGLDWTDICTCGPGETGVMPCESQSPFEVEFRRPNGARVHVLAARVKLAGERPGSVVVALDLTVQRATSESLRQAQLQLLQAQKLETIGRLAGGVAHDFNNLLTVIQGYTQIVQSGGSQTEGDAAALSQVLRAADRAASLTRQMLAFSCQQVLEPRVLDLGQVLTDTEKMVRRVIGQAVEILMRLPGNLGRVKADPVQVEQVLLNLVVNARDAMPRGGLLTLELKNFEVDAGFVAQHPEIGVGEYVMLSVSDDGEGMDPVVVPRIFEPFFTTKEAGKGTGLGLATVYGIVRQSGGTIWVHSVRHEGSAFHVLLPRVAEAVDGTLAPPARSHGNGEVVLVVEDDDMVRPITVAMLEQLGYHVLSAPDADGAMALSSARAGSIDLLLSDVVMRGRNGPELARDFLVERPGTPVLFVTGYAHEPRTVEELSAGGIPCLAKPFSLDALGIAVRRALTPSPNGRREA